MKRRNTGKLDGGLASWFQVLHEGAVKEERNRRYDKPVANVTVRGLNEVIFKAPIQVQLKYSLDMTQVGYI